MADEGQVIRGINWRQTFPFVNIFRAFRVAIHPSKLFLGLALLLTVYFGGRILDAVWLTSERAIPAEGANLDQPTIPGEVEQYQRIATGRAPGTLKEWRNQRNEQIDLEYAAILRDRRIDAPPRSSDGKPDTEAAYETRIQNDARSRSKISDVISAIIMNRDDEVKKADADKVNAEKIYAAGDKSSAAESARKSAETLHDYRVKSAYATAAINKRKVESFRGEGLFEAFFGYELNQINNVVEAVRGGSPGTALECVLNFLTVGPVWLIWNHTVFAILFALLFLFAWSLFGGAISRIAAVHVARDEKISVRQAMNFAVGKFLSFASAPVIPILIVVVIGLVLAAASLIGNLPFLGPIIVGVFFFLALLAGFVMTLVLLGTAGGFNLMYPTIAVEGSDSFDAISRSFSYVYARPWRMLFYTAVALIYGTATYLFVHMFISMMLLLTHHFVGMGIFASANNLQDLLSAMWPSPTSVGRLTYQIDYSPLNSGEKVGAFFIQFWVMLLVSFLGAFAISLYFSANTIIYYLMRAEVDATELDDVYLEQSDEDFGETPPLTPAGAPLAGTAPTTMTEIPPPPMENPAGI